MIRLLCSYICLLSFHAASGSKSSPSVEANMVAARSSACSPLSLAVMPYPCCSDIYPYMSGSAGVAKPRLAYTWRPNSLVSDRANTQKVISPGLSSSTPSSRVITWQRGGTLSISSSLRSAVSPFSSSPPQVSSLLDPPPAEAQSAIVDGGRPVGSRRQGGHLGRRAGRAPTRGN